MFDFQKNYVNFKLNNVNFTLKFFIVTLSNYFIIPTFVGGLCEDALSIAFFFVIILNLIFTPKSKIITFTKKVFYDLFQK